MPINSRAKGARGERELAAVLKSLFGWNARRTAQFCGKSGDSDVVVDELPDVFIEAKRVENLSIVPVMRKAVEQCNGKVPMICHRKDQCEWLCTLRLADLTQVAKMICLAECAHTKEAGSMCSAKTATSDTTAQ